jgi:hypothetical protein
MPITKASSSAVAPGAKGELVVGNATNDSGILSVGANGTVLTADSAEATGVKWATPAAGSLTLISTTTLSGSSTTISSIPSTYTNLVFVMKDVSVNATVYEGWFRFNGLSTSIYDGGYNQFTGSSIEGDIGTGTLIKYGTPNSSSTNPIYAIATIPRYASSDVRKFITMTGSKQGSSRNIFCNGCVQIAGAISSITIGITGTTYTSGTVYLYGVN